MWQLGTLIGAPVGITLIAGIAVPAMVIGIPVYVGRKVRSFVSRHSQKRGRMFKMFVILDLLLNTNNKEPLVIRIFCHIICFFFSFPI